MYRETRVTDEDLVPLISVCDETQLPRLLSAKVAAYLNAIAKLHTT